MVAYDLSADELLFPRQFSAGTSWNNRAYRVLTKAWSLGMIEGVLEFSRSEVSGGVDYSTQKTYTSYVETAPIIVFDTATKTARYGTIDDIDVSP